jgi:hypothetical protein
MPLFEADGSDTRTSEIFGAMCPGMFAEGSDVGALRLPMRRTDDLSSQCGPFSLDIAADVSIKTKSIKIILLIVRIWGD